MDGELERLREAIAASERNLEQLLRLHAMAVVVVEEALALRRSGYDGSWIGSVCEPLYEALTEWEHGRIVLDDPLAAAVVRAVEKHYCRMLYNANRDRVAYFRRRALERGLAPSEVVIVLLAVDDHNGAALADVLMPGHDWQAFRDLGKAPVARGLAGREGIQQALEMFDGEAAEKLRATNRLAVVVVDRGVAEVF